MASHKTAGNLSCHLDKCSAVRKQHPSSALPLRNHRKTSCSQLCEVIQLKVQQNSLEKTQKILISTLKNLESHYVKELSDLNEELTRKRLQESEKLKKEVMTVIHLLKDLKKEIAIENLKELNIDQFQASLMDLDNKIAALKDTFGKQLCHLCRQEQDLQVHVTSISNKIDEWAKPIKIDTVVPSVHRTAVLFNSGSSYNESVNAFQKFLRDQGGHTGGWNEGDHLTFMRLQRKHQNKRMLYAHLNEEFPDKSLEELYEHDQWFAEYEDLKEKQKQAITNWRCNKNNVLRRTVSCTDQVPVQTLSKELQKVDFCSSEYREQQKQQLEQWRNMKELEMQMKALMRKEEKQKQLAEEKARKIRHAIQKAELEHYKEQKLKEELAIALEKHTLDNVQAEERACNANKTLKAFRQRDAEILARQKEMKDRLQQEGKKKQRALDALREKVRVEVARDPHRLMRPTGAWKEHMKVMKSADSVSSRLTVPLNVQEVPHLGIPMWRKNQK